MKNRTASLLTIAIVLAGLIGVGGLRSWAQETGSEEGSAPPTGSGEALPEEGGDEEAVPSGPAQFIGAERCGRCHRMDRTGDQLGHWQESAHAQAYAVLASPEAQAIATERGIANAQGAAECLGCHQTAFGVGADLLGEDFDSTQGVQCESCHGAGSNYAPRAVMLDHEASLAAGLIVPDEALCRTCHNEESPTFQGFDFEAAAAEVAHPNPESAE